MHLKSFLLNLTDFMPNLIKNSNFGAKFKLKAGLNFSAVKVLVYPPLKGKICVQRRNYRKFEL